jgi:hypothetical protein
MSLREDEQARSGRLPRKSKKQVLRHKQERQQRFSALLQDSDNRILSFREWCQLNCISERTGRRIVAGGTGPVVTQLSAHRIGISVGNNRRWQESRARGEQA